MMPSLGAKAAHAITVVAIAILATHASGCASRHGGSMTWPDIHRSNQPAGIPGSWTALENLAAGSPIVITTRTGDRVAGEFAALASPLLNVNTRVGLRSILLTDVAKIVQPGQNDNLANGIAVGVGIGLGTAIAILTAVGTKEGYVLPSAKIGAPLLLSGAGGLIGALIDRAHQKERVIYLAAPF